MALQSNQIYTCIHCGCKADRLYQDYKNGIIKIEHCKNCNEPVDKYKEFDTVIICLDALLLKREAFQHVLYNSKIQRVWKLTAILLICDAYVKLVEQRSNGDQTLILTDYVIYSALEWGLYFNYFLAVMELVVSTTFVLLVISVQLKLQTGNFSLFSLDVLHGLLLSNFGKILVIPAVLWGHNHSCIYVWLSKCFVSASNIQALRVLKPTWKVWYCIIIVCLGQIIAMVMSTALKNQFPHAA